MGGVVWFIIFGALFFLMMRFGCGAHAGHGGHHSGQAKSASDQRDPVCGMQVPPEKGYAKMQEGRQYRFCSRECLSKFEADPSRYTANAVPSPIHGGHSS